MTDTAKPAGGRLAGPRSDSYLRAVNQPEARASAFTVRYMLASDIAYVLTATELGFTPRASARSLLTVLLPLLDKSGDIDTTKPPGDIVAQREVWVSELAGKPDTAWLHLGRNRGESLRNYLPQMFFRQTLHDEGREIARMLANLVSRAAPVLTALAPNYHHLQHSGFTTLGEYLLSWAVVFERHVERLQQADQRLDKGPSVIGGRQEVKDLYDRVSARLGFSQRARVRRDGIWVQDQFSEPFFVLSLIAVDLARMAQDLRVWMTPEFGLVELADEHAGGSSALPHAKVPFGLQAVIGGGVMASSRLAAEMAASCNPSEGSEPIYQSGSLYELAEDVVAWTRYMADIIEKANFKLDEMARKALLDYAGSSEAHDRLVYDFGVPFRTGHRVLGTLVRNHFLGEPALDLRALLKSETGRDIDVDQSEILDIMLGKTIWPTTFDHDALRRTWEHYRGRSEAVTAHYDGTSDVDTSIDALTGEARQWLAAGEPASSAP
jgi:argininosuccinate lyase